MKNIILKTLTVVGIVALSTNFAQATNSTNQLQVEITITTDCTVNFPNNSDNINFETYTRISSVLVEMREVSGDCNATNFSNTVASGQYSLRLDESLNAAVFGGFAAGRKLASGTNYISYDVRQAINLLSRSCVGKRWDASNPFSGSITTTAGDTPTLDSTSSHYFAACILVPAVQSGVGSNAYLLIGDYSIEA